MVMYGPTRAEEGTRDEDQDVSEGPVTTDTPITRQQDDQVLDDNLIIEDEEDDPLETYRPRREKGFRRTHFRNSGQPQGAERPDTDDAQALDFPLNLAQWASQSEARSRAVDEARAAREENWLTCLASGSPLVCHIPGVHWAEVSDGLLHMNMTLLDAARMELGNGLEHLGLFNISFWLRVAGMLYALFNLGIIRYGAAWGWLFGKIALLEQVMKNERVPWLGVPFTWFFFVLAGYIWLVLTLMMLLWPLRWGWWLVSYCRRNLLAIGRDINRATTRVTDSVRDALEDPIIRRNVSILGILFLISALVVVTAWRKAVDFGGVLEEGIGGEM